MATATEARVSVSAALALAALGLLEGLWSVYQWVELSRALDGADLSCSVSETVDCARVWAAPSAKAIHELTGVPVAGWGVVWGLAALVAGLRVYWARRRGVAVGAAVWGARMVAIGGVVAVVFLFAVSAQMGVFCPTCVGTYGIVGAYVGVAVFGARAPRPAELAGTDLLPVVVTVVVGWLIVLYPGLRTPTGSGGLDADAGTESAEAALRRVTNELPPNVVSEIRRMMRTVATSTAGPTPRRRIGPAQAPLRLTDFSDVLCGHCKNLVEVLHTVRARYPGRFSEDARYFPLAAKCNPLIERGREHPSDATRCFATRALLCVEDHPSYAEFRMALFEAQRSLSVERVRALASEILGVSAAELDGCQTSKAVEAKLTADVALANQYGLRGTPLLLVNGVEVPNHQVVVLTMLLAGGDPDHPVLVDASGTATATAAR